MKMEIKCGGCDTLLIVLDKGKAKNDISCYCKKCNDKLKMELAASKFGNVKAAEDNPYGDMFKDLFGKGFGK